MSSTSIVFRIATFVNDTAQYEEMRQSFEHAGFVAPVARYTVEAGEPYEAINRLGQSSEPFVLLVHQDVRCDQGDGLTTLQERLEQLTRLDSAWGVAGNAGGTFDRRLIVHVADPHGLPWIKREQLPQRVATLDENFLVLRTSKRPRCSAELSGFHLYGADVCLQAARSGNSAYVIDFKVTHLSAGKRVGLDEATQAFAKAWSRRMPRYVRTSIGYVGLARPAFVSRIMTHPRVTRRLKP